MRILWHQRVTSDCLATSSENLRQDTGEPIDSFLKRVRLLASECKYADCNEQTIDAIIFGVNNDSVKTKLMKKDENLTVDQSLDLIRTEEVIRRQVADLSDSSCCLCE